MSRPEPSRLAPAVALVVVLGAHAAPSRAADTIETWDPGAFDLEVYAGWSGIGKRPATGAEGRGETVLGYGIRRRLSVLVGFHLEGAGDLASSTSGVYAGLFGTVLDTRHVDLDVLLLAEAGGPGYRSLGVRPGFELNLDHHPEMRTVGLYLRGFLGLCGELMPREAETRHTLGRLGVDLSFVLGGYVRFRHRHQLVFETHHLIRPVPAEGERAYAFERAALGYNVILHPKAELLTEVAVSPPEGGRRPSVSLMAGFIFTLPTR